MKYLMKTQGMASVKGLNLEQLFTLYDVAHNADQKGYFFNVVGKGKAC